MMVMRRIGHDGERMGHDGYIYIYVYISLLILTMLGHDGHEEDWS